MNGDLRTALRTLSGDVADLEELRDDLLADPQLVRELSLVWECPLDDAAQRAAHFSAAWSDERATS